jgi:hypothetical protein
MSDTTGVHQMPTTYTRKLTLADGMILIAALAAWFALIRMTLPLGSVPPRVLVILNLLFVVVDSLAPLSVAWLAIRLRQPRPRLRRLARQPGFAACAVSTLTLTTIWVTGLIPKVFHIGWIRPDFLLLIAAHCVGFAVVGSWLTLLLVGCWRPSPDWFDRIGRALGVVAILCLLTPWILQITTWR